MYTPRKSCSRTSDDAMLARPVKDTDLLLQSWASYVTNMHHMYSNCFTLSSSSAPCTSNWLRSSGIIGRSRVSRQTGRRRATARTRDDRGEVGGGGREGGLGGVRVPWGISSLSTGLCWLLVPSSSSDITAEKEETFFVRKSICISALSVIIQIIDVIHWR